MKKLLVALLLSTLLVSGCSYLSSHRHAWENAKQENPLELPPGLDRPVTNGTMNIPPPGNADTGTNQSGANQSGAAADQ